MATATPGCGQQEHSPDPGEKGDTEICKQVSGCVSDQYGGGTQQSPGSVPLPRRKDLRLPSCGNAAEYSEEPVVQQDGKRLQGRRYRNTQDNYGTESSDSYLNSERIPTKNSIKENASNEQPSDDETTGRECDRERQHEVHDDGIPRRRNTGPASCTKSTKTQVAHASLQTDSCDTLYVTKKTLTAYTIAVVQNAQAIQYDQMHVALQTARNQASLETPLKAEELMTAHFNLTVLANELDTKKTTDAQNTESLLLTQNRLPQLRMRRLTLRYQVAITLQIAIQRSHTLPELSLQPVEENTDLLTEYRRDTRLMTLGTMILILMSTHTI